MWMHQFKGTALPVLRAGSSSLATTCGSSEFKFACISKMCPLLALLAVRKQRHFPMLSGILRRQIFCAPLPGCQAGGGCALSLNQLWTTKSNTPQFQTAGGWRFSWCRMNTWSLCERTQRRRRNHRPLQPLHPAPRSRALALAHTCLESASAKSKFTPVPAGNRRLFQITA